VVSKKKERINRKYTMAALSLRRVVCINNGLLHLTIETIKDRIIIPKNIIRRGKFEITTSGKR
jgi:hypothetical protein